MPTGKLINKQKTQQLMLVTRKIKINSETNVLFNFHIMENMCQSLYRRELTDLESPYDIHNV